MEHLNSAHTVALLFSMIVVQAACDKLGQEVTIDDLMRAVVDEMNNTPINDGESHAEIVNGNLRITYDLYDVNPREVNIQILKSNLVSHITEATCVRDMGLRAILADGRSIEYIFFLKNKVSAGSFTFTRETCLENKKSLDAFIE